MRVISVEQMKLYEKTANASGYTYSMMMQKAGHGIAELIDARFDKFQGPILGLIGGGNNGGDTLLALAWLQQLGWMTYACLLKSRDLGDAELQSYMHSNGNVVTLSDIAELNRRVKFSIVLDGVIGTGFRPPITDEIGNALILAQQVFASARWIAVDCPSGVDCTGGSVSECTPNTGLTICLEAVKVGMLKQPAFSKVGELVVVDLGLSRFSTIEDEMVSVACPEEIRRLLPVRSPFSHKGTFGKTLVVGGSVNYYGAPILASKGAYAVGTGLVRAATSSLVTARMAGPNPEITWFSLPALEGPMDDEVLVELLSILGDFDSIVIGPGLGTGIIAMKLVSGILLGAFPGKPRQRLPACLIDADALNILAGIHEWEKRLAPGQVLTPHPGEMARLTGISIGDIQNDRVGVSRKYAKRWNQTVVLKGPLTAIAEPNGQVTIIPLATSALAKGGSGDVLAGMIAGYLAQGMRPGNASILAAWIHACAGEMAAQTIGAEDSILPKDIINSIPKAIQCLRVKKTPGEPGACDN